MKGHMLDARLGSAAELVRQGAVFADIGTDHAHLPIFLLESGRIERAVCSDINAGPLASAERNIAEHGLSDRVELVLTDGVSGLGGKGITDYAVCGMGGEMIADIVSVAPELRTPDVRLILQPMTRQEVLRSALYSSGFEIISERYSTALGKYYVCMLVGYTGELRALSEVEAHLGVSPIVGGRAEYLGYLEGKLRALNTAIEGRSRAEIDTSVEATVARAIAKRIELVNASINT